MSATAYRWPPSSTPLMLVVLTSSDFGTGLPSPTSTAAVWLVITFAPPASSSMRNGPRPSSSTRTNRWPDSASNGASTDVAPVGNTRSCCSAGGPNAMPASGSLKAIFCTSTFSSMRGSPRVVRTLNGMRTPCTSRRSE